MSDTLREQYLGRFRNVLAYIDANLHQDLSLEALSARAAFSKYHFHRQFAALFGIGVYRYVRLCRLKSASYQLAFYAHKSVIDIALASGYEGPEAFARAFKKTFGQTPSDFRKQPQWNPWYATHLQLKHSRMHCMKSSQRHDSVSIVHVNDIKVAVLEHHGDPSLIGEAIRKFIQWRKENHLPRHSSATFNIFYNGPEDKDHRLDLCAAIEQDVAPNELGIVTKIIPAGRCAMLRHVGSDDMLGASFNYLYSQWLPQSGEELRDFPLYMQRVKFFPDVAENAAVSDIYLPLR